MKPTRIIELDLLRFLAALSVMLHHYFGRGWSIYGATRFGFLGVELFFMISGFVILWTSMSKTGLEFAASRISRLYPTFWVCALLTFLLLWLAGKPESGYTLAANLTMVPRSLGFNYLDYVYWTLQLEVIFYALMMAPIVMRQMNYIQRWLWVWLGIAIAAAALNLWDSGILKLLTLRGYAPFFIAGCAFFLIRTYGPTTSRIVMLITCAVVGIPRAIYSGEEANLLLGSGDQILVAAIVLALFAGFSTVALKLWRLPDWRIWGILGAMTYPLYLLHYQNFVTLAPLAPGNLGTRTAVAICAVLSLSLLLAVTVERKICPAFNRALLKIAERLRIYTPRRSEKSAV